MAAGVLVLGYRVVWVAASATCCDWTIAPGDEKHFCETDCHLAYCVTRVDRTMTVAMVSNQTDARGVFDVLPGRARFYERTIFPHRGNGPLTPSPRVAMLIADQRRSSSISPEGERARELCLAVTVGHLGCNRCSLAIRTKPRWSIACRLVRAQ